MRRRATGTSYKQWMGDGREARGRKAVLVVRVRSPNFLPTTQRRFALPVDQKLLIR